MKKALTILAGILLSANITAQVTFDVYQGQDTIQVTLEDPLRDHLEVDLYHCYFWTDTEGGGFYNFDFNGSGFVDVIDLLTLLQYYGGQIQIPTNLAFIEQFGQPSDPIDAPDLNLFDFACPGDGIYSSGILATIPEEYEHLVFEDRLETFGYPCEDFIGQYTASDELFPGPDCPLEDWDLCMRTFKSFLFVTQDDGENIYVESYYWIRLP